MTDLSVLGSASGGVWTRAQALALMTPGRVDALVRAGTWQVLWRGVYCDGGYDVTAEQRALAAVLAAGGERRSCDGAPRAIACGRTAARVWGFPLIDDRDPATRNEDHLLDDVWAPGRHLPAQSYDGRALLPQQARLTRVDIVRLESGLWLTSAPRTLLECARLLTHEALVCAVDDALHRHVVTRADVARAAASRARGAPALRAAIAVADGRAEAPTETLARLLLAAVLPGLEPQVELFDHAMRRIARFDLAVRAARLAVEADGKRGHSGGQMVAKDRRRDRVSEALGWTTERVTWFELRREQAAFVQRIVRRHGQLVGRGGGSAAA